MTLRRGEENMQSIKKIEGFVCTKTIKMLTGFRMDSSLSISRSFLGVVLFFVFGRLSSDWRLIDFKESFDTEYSLVDALPLRWATAPSLHIKKSKIILAYSI